MMNLFENAFRRVERAKRKIKIFEKECEPLFGGDAVELVSEAHDINGVAGIAVKLRPKIAIPDELSDLVDTSIDGLRAALDFACYGSAVATGAINPKSAYFPFADDAAQLENTIKGRCKDLHDDVVELLRSFKPYAEGNKILWAFNKARQSNQHKTLIDFTLRTSDVSIHNLHIVGDAPGLETVGLWSPESREYVILQWIDAGDMKIEIDAININSYPALVDAGVLTGEPVIPALNEFARTVEDIVMAIKAETERLIGEN